MITSLIKLILERSATKKKHKQPNTTGSTGNKDLSNAVADPKRKG